MDDVGHETRLDDGRRAPGQVGGLPVLLGPGVGLGSDRLEQDGAVIGDREGRAGIVRVNCGCPIAEVLVTAVGRDVVREDGRGTAVGSECVEVQARPPWCGARDLDAAGLWRHERRAGARLAPLLPSRAASGGPILHRTPNHPATASGW